MKCNKSTVVESKPKSFLVKLPQPLYGVLEALAEYEGYSDVKSLVEQFISQYSKTRLMTLRDDRESIFHQCWQDMFDENLDDNVIKEVCKL